MNYTAWICLCVSSWGADVRWHVCWWPYSPCYWSWHCVCFLLPIFAGSVFLYFNSALKVEWVTMQLCGAEHTQWIGAWKYVLEVL